jgi:hypothetical protein
MGAVAFVPVPAAPMPTTVIVTSGGAVLVGRLFRVVAVIAGADAGLGMPARCVV